MAEPETWCIMYSNNLRTVPVILANFNIATQNKSLLKIYLLKNTGVETVSRI